jgi:hypothetical protein
MIKTRVTEIKQCSGGIEIELDQLRVEIKAALENIEEAVKNPRRKLPSGLTVNAGLPAAAIS